MPRPKSSPPTSTSTASTSRSRRSNDFTWHDVCDWYVEMVKPRLASGDAAARGILCHLLRETTKLLHRSSRSSPRAVAGARRFSGLGVRGPIPERGARGRDPEAEEAMGALKGMTGGVRSVRAEWNVPASATLSALVKAGPHGYIGPVVERLRRARA